MRLVPRSGSDGRMGVMAVRKVLGLQGLLPCVQPRLREFQQRPEAMGESILLQELGQTVDAERSGTGTHATPNRTGASWVSPKGS